MLREKEGRKQGVGGGCKKKTEIGPGSTVKTAHLIHRLSAGRCQSRGEVTQQRESKVLRQQLRQVKWNNGVTGRVEEGGGVGGREGRPRRKGLK